MYCIVLSGLHEIKEGLGRKEGSIVADELENFMVY